MSVLEVESLDQVLPNLTFHYVDLFMWKRDYVRVEHWRVIKRNLHDEDPTAARKLNRVNGVDAMHVTNMMITMTRIDIIKGDVMPEVHDICKLITKKRYNTVRSKGSPRFKTWLKDGRRR